MLVWIFLSEWAMLHVTLSKKIDSDKLVTPWTEPVASRLQGPPPSIGPLEPDALLRRSPLKLNFLPGLVFCNNGFAFDHLFHRKHWQTQPH
jgi:hypothetical protein